MDQKALKAVTSPAAACGGRWETRLELPIETELLIPDYLPAVFKIVKCLVEPVVMQNAVTGQRWQGEGYLRCTVYYQSDEAGTRLYRTEQKYAFEKTAELPECSYLQGAARLWGETEYCNCRAVSEHRIDLRGAYTLCVAVGVTEQLELLTDLSGCGIQQRTVPLTGVACAVCEEKTFTAQTTFPLPGAGETILDISGIFVPGSQTVRTGQLDCAGTLSLQVCYRAANEEALTVRSKDLPVTQTVELPDAAEGDDATVWGDVLACTLTAPEEDGKEPALAVTWKLHAELWRPVSLRAVVDAYSTVCETSVERRPCRLLQSLAAVDSAAAVQIEDDLPDPEATVQGCFVTLEAPQLAAREEGGVQVTGRGTAHLFCADARGELTCYDKTFTWALPEPLDGAIARSIPHLHAALTRVNSSKNGSRVRVELSVAVTGRVLAMQSSEVATAVELGEEFPDHADGPALHLYYAAPGESIFEIAKRYHARAGDLAAANGLETGPDAGPEDLTTGAVCLLIPAAL